MFIKKIYYKFHLDILWGYISSFFTRITWKKLNIMTPTETIQYILTNRVSVARFGDGELHILAYGCPLKFQRADKQLQKRLTEISRASVPQLLLCLPDRINCISSHERAKLSPFWQKSLKQHLYMWTRTFSKTRLYGNTNISRLTEGSSYENKIEFIELIKQIWDNRDVIIVEGALTRFGVGNDLLDNASSVRRILGPAESAFDMYETIYKETKNIAERLNKPLILIALGPTATVLASDLSSSGFQAIDIGHLDISYEHLMKGSKGLVSGKYVNEIEGGNIVSACSDPKYLSEIVLTIKQ